jgi:hypothetical protein
MTVLPTGTAGESKVVATINGISKTANTNGVAGSVRVGKPDKILESKMHSKFATIGAGGGGSGYGGMYGAGFGNLSGSVSWGNAINPYSPELSTDFLELPNSQQELRNTCRFFYDNDAIVGQAIDSLTDIPLLKVRVGMPEALNVELARKAMRFCERWVRSQNLLEKLIWILHEINLFGEAFIWVEDSDKELPQDLLYEEIEEIRENGEKVTIRNLKNNANELHVSWLRKNYKGWTNLTVLPPHQVRMESFPFTRRSQFEFIPDSKARNVVSLAESGDTYASRVVNDMPREIVESIRSGRNIPLNTDPDAGSFCFYMARKRSAYAERGKSIIQRIIRPLTHRDKLRQAQASIASRHMTPMRVIQAEGASDADLDVLREHVDHALSDPDFTIIVNYVINWEEMNSNGRLLDLDSEYTMAERQMYIGLGVTESLLNGESSYQENSLSTQLLSAKFMHVRMMLQHFVEQYIFRPMCARMGFIEEDEDGQEHIITPTLMFNRMTWRDSPDTAQQLITLFERGAVDIDTIHEYFNLDTQTTVERMNNNMYTIKDPFLAEALRSMASSIGSVMAEKTNALDKYSKAALLSILADSVDPRFAPPPGGGL